MSRKFSEEKAVVAERKRIVAEFVEPLQTYLDGQGKADGSTRLSVAADLGLQRNALYKFFRGTQTPTVDTLARISVWLRRKKINRGCA